MGRRLRGVLLGCSLLVSVRGTAHAQPTSNVQPTADKPAAASDAKKAAAAMKAHKFQAAGDLYDNAYKESPEPRFLLGAAAAWQKSGEPARAANRYARYLAEAPAKAPAREKSKRELAILAGQLGQLVVKADGASRVTVDGGVLDTPLPPIVYVSVGSHEVAATFGEKTATQTVASVAATSANVTLVAPPPAPPAPPSTPVAAAVEPPSSSATKTAGADGKRKPLPPAAAFVGIGLTVVAGGITVLSAIDTSKQKAAFNDDRSQANLESGRSKQLRTNVLIGVTGGLGLVTGVVAIFLVDWKGKSDNVKVGLGPGSIVALGTF